MAVLGAASLSFLPLTSLDRVGKEWVETAKVLDFTVVQSDL